MLRICRVFFLVSYLSEMIFLVSCITTIIVPCVAHFNSSNTDEHIAKPPN